MTIERLAEVLGRVIERKNDEIKELYKKKGEAEAQGREKAARCYYENSLYEEGKLNAFEEVRCFIGKEQDNGALENV